ncbi:hypothetical protein [Scandinavium goeteborgense]|uniref:Uncharacterized protein n=1 Tax=Scandinavium goeteborgense TaxID=1851514 RepID=A0A4V3BLV3_SCAGO|nr:hypothetical protein [Scandinavium goeteborgense]TDN48082.1 hypothetical protein EC847_12833 [Scandinavium goeteborgense]
MDNKQVDIVMTFHDIVNVIMWDDSQNKNGESSRVPCGAKVALWLARAFTLSNVSKYRDRGMFVLAKYYKKNLPDAEKHLKDVQEFYITQIRQYRKEAKANPLISLVALDNVIEPVNFEIKVMPCPPVLMFVRTNMLCDEAHTELRKLYMCGGMTKSEYFKQRRELFRPINRFRADFAATYSSAGKLSREAQEKAGD